MFNRVTLPEVLVCLAVGVILVLLLKDTVLNLKTTTVEKPTPIKETCQIERGDARYNDVNYFTFRGHSYIQFGGGYFRWGVHDPDCGGCKK